MPILKNAKKTFILARKNIDLISRKNASVKSYSKFVYNLISWHTHTVLNFETILICPLKFRPQYYHMCSSPSSVFLEADNKKKPRRAQNYYLPFGSKTAGTAGSSLAFKTDIRQRRQPRNTRKSGSQRYE